MKAGKKETTCLLGIAGKCSVKASVHAPVKGKKDESESVIKEKGKEKVPAGWRKEMCPCKSKS